MKYKINKAVSAPVGAYCLRRFMDLRKKTVKPLKESGHGRHGEKGPRFGLFRFFAAIKLVNKKKK